VLPVVAALFPLGSVVTKLDVDPFSVLVMVPVVEYVLPSAPSFVVCVEMAWPSRETSVVRVDDWGGSVWALAIEPHSTIADRSVEAVELIVIISLQAKPNTPFAPGMPA
jgi:hypothetical protein